MWLPTGLIWINAGNAVCVCNGNQYQGNCGSLAGVWLWIAYDGRLIFVNASSGWRDGGPVASIGVDSWRGAVVRYAGRHRRRFGRMHDRIAAIGVGPLRA
jgi:hypothetical protein